MIKINIYRNEWKYQLNNQNLVLLKSRLEKVLSLDPHTPANGRYLTHSLYFDDYKDNSVYTTEAGISNRYKWRIRYYGDDLNYLILEKKIKKESRCHKKSCRLTIAEYQKIVKGEITDILYDTNKELIKELASDMLRKGYIPKVIVDYERIAFVEEITNIRVTFDMKISASYEIDKFLEGNYHKFYIQNSNYNILEVKFDSILPSHIKKIIESYNFKQSSFSKYYYCRKIIDCYMR